MNQEKKGYRNQEGNFLRTKSDPPRQPLERSRGSPAITKNLFFDLLQRL
jgi:hypothetical protein